MRTHHRHDPLQSAYKPGHSTETSLLKIKNDIDSALDRGQGVLLLLLDLSAAFDSLDHDVLIERLKAFIWGGHLWESSRLVQVLPFIQETACCSEWNSLGPSRSHCWSASGIRPRAPVVSDLHTPTWEDNRYFQVARHGYADDTQLYTYFTLSDMTSLSSALNQLQRCAAAVKMWLIKNKLKLNDSKTEFLITAPKFHLTGVLQTKLTVTIGKECIAPTPSARNLGATFWFHHVYGTSHQHNG